MAKSASWIKKNMFDSPDVKSKTNRRILTEAEIRVQRSLEKLSIPEWYLNNSSKPPKILLRNSPDTRPGWRSSTGKSPMQFHKLSDSNDKRLSMNSSYPHPKPTRIVEENHNQTVAVLLETSFDQGKNMSAPKPPTRKIRTNISKTFPKLSPSRKIENINIIFPPKKLDLDKSPNDSSTMTASEGLSNSSVRVTNLDDCPQLYKTAMIDEVTLNTTPYDSDLSDNYVEKKLANNFSNYLHLCPMMESQSNNSLTPIEETSEGNSNRATPSPTLNETFLVTKKKSTTLEKIVKAERPNQINKLVQEIIEALKKKSFNNNSSENNSNQPQEMIEPVKTVVNVKKSQVPTQSYPVKCNSPDLDQAEAEMLRKKIIEEKKREYYTKLAYLEKLKKMRGIPPGEKVQNFNQKVKNSTYKTQRVQEQKAHIKIHTNSPEIPLSQCTPCRETTESLKRYQARHKIKYTSSPKRQYFRREKEEQEEEEEKYEAMENNSGLLQDIIGEFRKKCKVSYKQKSTPGTSNFVKKLVDVLERSVDQSYDASIISSVYPIDEMHDLSDPESIYETNSTSISLKNSDSDVYASSTSPDLNWSTVANTGARPIEDDEEVYWIPLPKKPLVSKAQDSFISPYTAGTRYIKPSQKSQSSAKFSYSRLSSHRSNFIQGSYNYDPQRKIWTSTLEKQNRLKL